MHTKATVHALEGNSACTRWPGRRQWPSTQRQHRPLAVQVAVRLLGHHLAEAVGIRLREAKSGAAIKAEGLARHLRRVGREAVIVADVAPEAAGERLKAAVLKAATGLAVRQPQVPIQSCTCSLSLLPQSRAMCQSIAHPAMLMIAQQMDVCMPDAPLL